MRYNIFFRIHQGLRSMLHETALQLQRTDFTNPTEAACLLESVTEALYLFHKHAHTEDELIFPMIQDFEPAVQDAFEQEHQKDELLASLVEESLKLYANTETPEERQSVGQTIQLNFGRFLVFNLEHMAREEEVLNPLLWHYYTDTELLHLTAQIVANTPVALQPRFNQWILRGMNNADILLWMKQVEKLAPAPVFQGLLDQAAEQLPAARYRKLLEGMKDATWLG